MTMQHHETGSALAIRDDQAEFTDTQKAALRQIGVSGASDGDLQVFFHQSQRTGLDPFARQIYMIGRRQWNPDTRQNEVRQTIQTGIDGFRLIARRASDAAREPFGYEDTIWCGTDGRWTDVWLSTDAPAACKVVVLRNGQRFPAVALYSEYAGLTKEGKPTKMWAEKGSLMLAKCAEALALRKAFPQDLSGLYTADEMARADSRETASEPAPAIPAPSTSIRDAIKADAEPFAVPLRTAEQSHTLAYLLRAASMTEATEALAYIGGIIGRPVESTKTLTLPECALVIDALENLTAAIDADTGEVYEAELLPTEQP